jgi:hypothetical protein
VALKKGQIAHLDQDRNVNSISNLVYLCFDHHDEYDSTTRQSKGLTRAEVTAYRGRLHEYVRTSLSLASASKDFVVSSIEEQEVVVETIERYFQVGYTSPSTIAAEVSLRIKRIQEYQRALEKEMRRVRSAESDEEKDRRWRSTTRRLRKALAIPEGLWGLEAGGDIPASWMQRFRRLSKGWSHGKLSVVECEHLFWLLDEEMDIDQYFVLFGHPHGTLGALGIAAFDSFLFHFGARNAKPAESGSRE